MSNLLLILASRALWCVGMALLLIGTVLVSEGSAFADPGDPDWCAQMCQQTSQDGDQYYNCTVSCMGGDYNGIDCIPCSVPGPPYCPTMTGGCINTVRCTGRLCYRRCLCANLYPSGCDCESK